MDNPDNRIPSPTPLGPEGPFYIPNQAMRSDIREDKEGLPIKVKFVVKDFNNNYKLIPNAQVEVWHADPLGKYSGYASFYPLDSNRVRIEGHVDHTDDERFLRGVQITDDNGAAEFQTIYPGWYGSRTPHIHFKIIIEGKDRYTGEVYFEDSLTDEIDKSVKPYCDRDASNKKNNETDTVFSAHNGYKTIIRPEGDITTSLAGTLTVIAKTQDE